MQQKANLKKRRPCQMNSTRVLVWCIFLELHRTWYFMIPVHQFRVPENIHNTHIPPALIRPASLQMTEHIILFTAVVSHYISHAFIFCMDTHQFDLFPTSTKIISANFSALRLYFDLNLLRLFFEKLYFATQIGKGSKTLTQSKRSEIKRPKSRKGRTDAYPKIFPSAAGN